MADFCTKCHHDHGFPGEPDIDIAKEASDLMNGYMKGGYICEGCGLSGIARGSSGILLVFMNEEEGWVPYES